MYVKIRDFLAYFVKDWFEPPSALDKLKRNTGGIFKVEGKKRAIYCNAYGKHTVLSPVCPHMGCIVAWNDAEKTWDCPVTVLASLPRAN